MQYSYSRVDTFIKCKFKYKLTYIDELEALPNLDDASNPLLIGLGLHKGIETDVETGIKEYLKNYYIIGDDHITEIMKLENLIPRIKELLPPNCKFEVTLENDDFIGYIDLLVDKGNNEYEIYDFKYSNNKKNYYESAQLHIYKYFFEKLNKDAKVTKLGFIFAPKTKSRAYDEDVISHRKKALESISKSEIEFIEIKYNPNKVIEFLTNIKHINECSVFDKCNSFLCNYCDYKDFCKNGETYMLIPKYEVRDVKVGSRVKIWLYGLPYSGKTRLADTFEKPLFLNTDGNINSFKNQYVSITPRNEVGKLSKSAWEIFTQVLDELENSHEYKTIVVDLIDDVYEACRLHMYKVLKIDHEQDASFKAWDAVRTQFLSTIKRLTSMQQYNVILISHLDTSKDITLKSSNKITAIKPNLNEKVSNKLAGLVDMTVRLSKDDNGVSRLYFDRDGITFGGSRIKVEADSIPATYEALKDLYDKQTDDVSVEQRTVETNRADTKPTVTESEQPSTAAGTDATETNDNGNETKQDSGVTTETTTTVRRRRVRATETKDDEEVPF